MVPSNPHDVDPFESGWEGIPIARERNKMSIERLAILLSKQEKDSRPYILLSHELNVRIANIQAKASYRGAAIGLAGAIVGAILTTTIPVIIPHLNSIYQRCYSPCEQYKQGPIAPPKPPTLAPVGKGGKVMDIKSDNNTNQNK